MIFASIALRQETIFSKAEWKYLPWLLYPERQDSMKFLVDIMADLPWLFLQQDAISLKPSENSESLTTQVLSTEAKKILADLERWKEEFLFGSEIQYTEVSSPSSTPTVVDSNGKSRPIWNTVLQFNSMDDAMVVTLYNSLIIMVLRFILGEELEGRDLMIRISGMTVCRSVDYYLDVARDGLGSLFLLFPLKMAHEAVGETDPIIGTWLKEILMKISSGLAGRWGAAQYLLDIKSRAERFV
jgi:hypothetical protein